MWNAERHRDCECGCDAGDTRASDPAEQRDALAWCTRDRAKDLEQAAEPARCPGTEARPEHEHDDDAEGEQGRRPERESADDGRGNDQRRENEPPPSGDRSGDAARAPEAVVAGKGA